MEQSGERGGLEGSLESFAQPPRYPNLYIVTGLSGVGKSTVANFLPEQLDCLTVLVSATDRLRRPSEKSKSSDGLSAHAEHEFLSREKMDDRIASAKQPIVWKIKDEKGVPHRYLLDYAVIERALANGKDTLTTATLDATEKLLEKNPEAYVIYLKASQPARRKQMASQGRRKGDIEARARSETYTWRKAEPLAREYGSVIRNWKLGRMFEQFPLDYLVIRLLHLKAWVGEHHSPGLPTAKMHAAYARDVERAFSGTEEPLRQGQLITIPKEVVDEYTLLVRQQADKHSKGKPVDYQSLLPHMATIRITEIKDEESIRNDIHHKKMERYKNGVRSIHLLPEMLKDRPLTKKQARSYNDALLGLLELYLGKQGLQRANSGFSVTLDKQQLEYHLTDYMPLGPSWNASDIYAVNFIADLKRIQGQSLPR